MDVVEGRRVEVSVEELLADFARWLSRERGVAGEPVRCYRTQARKFLVRLPAPLAQPLAGVDAATVTGYVLEQAAAADSVWSARLRTSTWRHGRTVGIVQQRQTLGLVTCSTVQVRCPSTQHMSVRCNGPDIRDNE